MYFFAKSIHLWKCLGSNLSLFLYTSTITILALSLESIYDNAVLSLNDTTKEKSVEEFLNRKNSNISYNLLPIYNHIESQYRKTLNAYKKRKDI